MLVEPRAVLVTGAQGAGKSTVGRRLAERCRRGAFIEGDLLWKMVVVGGADMSSASDAEAQRLLKLRYRHGAMLAESFVEQGFVAVHADNVYGEGVTDYLGMLGCPRSLVVLRPSVKVIEAREIARGTNAYGGWITGGASLRDAIAQFDGWVGESPPIGLWIDSSNLSADETVDEIVRRWPETFVE